MSQRNTLIRSLHDIKLAAWKQWAPVQMTACTRAAPTFEMKKSRDDKYYSQH